MCEEQETSRKTTDATGTSCDVNLEDEESLHEDDIFPAHSSENHQLRNLHRRGSHSISEGTIRSTTKKEEKMSNALSSYFSSMVLERETQCQNLTVVVDNAHIPLSQEVLLADSMSKSVTNPEDAFSHSLSSINHVAFPPPFLKNEEKCRWEPTSSDVRKKCVQKTDSGLLLPRRSQDSDTAAVSSLDVKMPARARESRTNFPLEHTSSLDSTVRWLRELPLDLSDHSIRSRREMLLSPKRQDSLIDAEDGDEDDSMGSDDLPLLKKPYLEGDTHPRAILRKLSEGSQETTSSIAISDDESEDASIDTLSDNETADSAVLDDDMDRQARNPAHEADGILHGRLDTDETRLSGTTWVRTKSKPKQPIKELSEDTPCVNAGDSIMKLLQMSQQQDPAVVIMKGSFPYSNPKTLPAAGTLGSKHSTCSEVHRILTGVRLLDETTHEEED